MKGKRLNCILVDNSSIERQQLAKLVANHPFLKLLASYQNAKEVIEKSVKKNIDLIFLDMDIPHLDGFELLKTFKQRPEVIIISHNPNYALKAFENDVADYLLKPIEFQRFNVAVEKALFKSGIPLEKSREPHIFVKHQSRSVRIMLSDIKWVEALGDYVKLVTENTNLVILSSLKSFAEQLPKKRFVRIHKSYIINLQKVENFNSSTIDICGRQMPLSRKRKNEFREAVGLYI